MKIINGKKLAEDLNDKLGQDIVLYKNKFKKNPSLVVILVGENEASKVYVRNKEKKALEVGINSTVTKLSKDISENDLLQIIEKYNNDNSIDGILVQLPLPNHLDSDKVIDKIAIEKDVDGFNSKNIGLLALGRPKVIPCTPLGCFKMLEETVNLEGKNVLILGRSNIVGKPLSYLLTNNNATITLAHSKTKNLKKICLASDIIVAAIGRPKFLKKDFIKQNAIILDVGINVIKDDSGSRKIVGDVDFENVINKVAFISPVPGGVGPMTIHCLLLNTYLLAKLRNVL
ncbi:MAG: bifunctional methylenetetrahydrofolate dehydrogenase/methenyltetrahydrofolate cyclohydrolase [Rickettsiales bacterium]|nr:bifunctional methylenetetrahydrofolate dehydrogenase/methenyltetrahydrofolate cyclohydrolase [Rickettsiales bacterium]OUV82325.1 MAG: bifunctional methylenetetrahydrofolate dehydrogenase/methenyltetrahydrofolate cyclohydrolase [Rickettsiales bacterium TMED131]